MVVIYRMLVAEPGRSDSDMGAVQVHDKALPTLTAAGLWRSGH